MPNDPLQKLNSLIELLQNDTITPKELEQFLSVFIDVVKKTKDGFEQITADRVSQMQVVYNKLLAENTRLLEKVESSNAQTLAETKKDIDEKMRQLASMMKTISEIEVRDGKDADEELIVERVLSRLPKPEKLELDNADQIVTKLLSLDEPWLDAKFIKNLPTPTGNAWRGGGSRYMSRLADVKVTDIQDGEALVWNASRGRFENSEVASSGGAWGSITGTLSDQTDLQSALDGKASTSHTHTFASLTSKPTTLAGYGITDAQGLDSDLTTIAGLTPSDDDFLQRKGGAWANRTVAQVKTDLGLSGTNTGDQDLSGLMVKANNLSDLTNASTARTNLGVAIGVNVQAFNQNLADIAGLADPNADRLLFWDDSAGAFKFLTLGTNLSITDTTINASGSGGVAWGDITGTLSDQTDLQTALDAKQDVLTGLTSSVAELNILDGVTATASEINILDGATLTVTELNYVDGVTSSIQTQLDGKVNTDQTVGQTIGTTGARLTKLWATDITVTNAISGSVTGNAGTATALQNARTIGGVSFDGTANITVATATGGFTVSGGDLAIGANNLTLTGSVGATGARATKVWATDIESTNMPTVGGVAILTSLTAPQFTTIELGHASDTTLSRASAGRLAVEGVNVMTISSTDVVTNKDLTSGTNTFPTFNQNTTGSAATLTTTRTLWGQNFNGSANVTGSLTSVGDITGGASSMTITAGTGNSRTLSLRSTTSGGTATLALLIDDVQRVIIGHTASLATGANSNKLQIYGTNVATSSMTQGAFSATAGNGAELRFYRSKNASIGSATVVASGDNLGAITWYGAQQTGTFSNQNPAAQIIAEVDGTVTSGAGADMPGRIRFLTSPDGSGTLAEVLRLDNAKLATFAGNLTVGTSNSITAGTIELGAASDTTLSRASAGQINVEGVQVVTVSNTVTLTNKTLTAPRIANAGFIADANGNEQMIFTTTASAVNELTLANAATGANPNITASGGDTNIGIDLTPKGTGFVQIRGNSTQAATLALYEDTDDGSNYSAFRGSARAGNIIYTMPTADPTAGQVLSAGAPSGGVSALSWTTAGGGDNPVFYPASTAYNRNSGGTITEGATADSDFIGCKTFPDGSLNGMIFPCKVPSGKTGISSMKLVIHGDSIGGNAYLVFYTSKVDVVSGGAKQTDLTDTYATYAITADSNTQLLTVPSGAYNGLTSITSDKIINLYVDRDASSGSDTHNTTLNVLGLLVTWS